MVARAMLSAPPVPRIPRPVPRRPPFRPMTIAAGFICSDGVLLASDTLYSGAVNRYGRKFWTLENPDVVFGGSGTERGLLRTRDEIRERLRRGMALPQIVRSVDDALREVNLRLEPTVEERTYALVAIRSGDSWRLYHNDGGGSMLSVIDHESQCVGWGASLGSYFSRTLFRPEMALRWAKVVAAQLIKQCKLHSGFCGGATHLVELPSAGEPRLIDDQEQIRQLETHLEVVDAVMRVILLDERANDDTLIERAAAMMQEVRKLEKMFYISTGDTLRVSADLEVWADITKRDAPNPSKGE